MGDSEIIRYVINDAIELNLSYMPFINDGGIFIPSQDNHSLDERVVVDLVIPGKKDPLRIEGKIIWITPKNAIHHVLPGIGIQFVGPNAATVRSIIEKNLDPHMEMGGYTYGITEEGKRS